MESPPRTTPPPMRERVAWRLIQWAGPRVNPIELIGYACAMSGYRNLPTITSARLELYTDAGARAWEDANTNPAAVVVVPPIGA